MMSVPSVADRGLADWLASLPLNSGLMDIAATRRSGDEAALAEAREPDLARVVDLEVRGLQARLYRPSLDRTGLLLYLHGGGWTIGSIETYDRLASRSGIALLSLEYRLAPEHPWPASIDDTVMALEWIAQRPLELGPTGAVAVGGDSAGGTLATLACHRLRERHSQAMPALQVLLYPNTDLTGAHPSMTEKATGYGLTAEGIRFFNRQWVPNDAQWSGPTVSPLHAPDLAGLPPALVVTAEHDPLRDEGNRYAERLAAAGVEVLHRCEPGLVHSFMRLDRVSPACAAAADRVADELAHLLNR